MGKSEDFIKTIRICELCGGEYQEEHMVNAGDGSNRMFCAWCATILTARPVCMDV